MASEPSPISYTWANEGCFDMPLLWKLKAKLGWVYKGMGLPEEELLVDVRHYVAKRQTTLKETFRAGRKEAGYSQQALADLLGCARSRIADIEDPEKVACYTLGEMELLPGLFSINPLDIVRMSGKEAIALGQFVTEKQTGAALLGLVD